MLSTIIRGSLRNLSKGLFRQKVCFSPTKAKTCIQWNAPMRFLSTGEATPAVKSALEAEVCIIYDYMYIYIFF